MNEVPIETINSTLEQKNAKFVLVLQKTQNLKLQTVQNLRKRKEAVLEQLKEAHQKSSQRLYSAASESALQTMK